MSWYRGIDWGERALRIVAAIALMIVASWLPGVRKALIDGITRVDGPPGAPPVLPAPPPDAAGLSPAPYTRVVLIDGVNREDALAMPAWSALCERGLDLTVDVGFPTVSLPVQVALWTGLTQQQTGVLFHSGYRLHDPIGARGVPARVPGSIAIAESHPYIVSSIGFATARPESPDGKALPEGWAEQWVPEARAAVIGEAPLAFVHVLRVDTAGHKKGRASPEWNDAITTSDAILADLVAAGATARPDARWFVLADHGHAPPGGHGGEERDLRVVRACIAGPGITPGTGGPIALVDLARAIADSTGVAPAPGSRGRPLAGALAAPLTGDELLPPLPRGRLVVALGLVLLGVVVTAWALGRRAAAWGPWWWPVALLGVMIALPAPSLSLAFVYAPKSQVVVDAARWGTYAGALVAAAAVLLGRRPGWRIAIAQVALPLAGLAAVLVLCGGLAVAWGDTAAPVTPRWSAWASVLLVITTRALWAVALALLATSVLPGSGRAAPRGTRRSDP